MSAPRYTKRCEKCVKYRQGERSCAAVARSNDNVKWSESKRRWVVAEMGKRIKRNGICGYYDDVRF